MLNTVACTRVAQKALREASRRALAYFDRPDRISALSDKDWVSNVHKDIYTTIHAELAAAYPDHAIYHSREKIDLTEPFVWLVEPLDGFENFHNGIGLFTSSCVLYSNGNPMVSLVYAPITDELFTAIKGSGAMLDGRRIRVDKAQSPEKLGAIALHKSGQLFYALQTDLPHALTQISTRDFGCLSLSLAYHASGRFMCVFATDFRSPSIAAAHLLAEEAGCVVKQFTHKASASSCTTYALPGLLSKAFYSKMQHA